MKRSRHQASQSNPSDFAPGQRWVSETQPELGIALIVAIDDVMVKAHFPATGEVLNYASRSAPLRRVSFEPGDTVKTQEETDFKVSDVRIEEKRYVYIDADGNELPESQLSDRISFQRPEARLLAGHIDEPHVWRLRQAAIRQRFEARARDVRGLTGARISLIPHQLYIADEVANRFAPRVLLADEVGLGKTIEACLILHRLNMSGRAKRILILVPDALINQWFVELYRRFAMSFSIYDEERIDAIEEERKNNEQDGSEAKVTNPFFEDQLVICGTSWIADNSERAAQIAAAEWDLAIVDEAHHLEWSPEEASPAYEAVSAIAEATPGLLLLTATPEQLGREGHFARLRLLDPDRFSDLEKFIQETEGYQRVSKLADQLRSKNEIGQKDIRLVKKLLGSDAARELHEDDSPATRQDLLRSLVDLHGTGRVMFRNRRIVLSGFPKRIAHLEPIFDIENTTEEAYFDAKVRWMADLLRMLPSQKFLLICHSRETAEAIEAALLDKISSTATLFHEGLTLVQRDRNAAWFSESESDGGARLLICSEIGSEGRNFQFAHHLVLFDLPEEPGLLEQRIGRLDRIGQESDIHIHVPYILGTSQELWARWYHEGLNAFEKTLHGGAAVYREFHERMTAVANDDEWEEKMPELIEETRTFKTKVDKELDAGRDHLLEIGSFRRDKGERLVGEINELDGDWKLEKFMVRLFDHFGVTVEDLRERQYLLKPEHLFSADAFPGLPEDGMSITFDRDTALAREELTFFTWDHPMVNSAIDSLLSSERGNAAFARIEAAAKQILMLEVVFILETVAPEKLHVDRFLPAQPVSVLVDHEGNDQSEQFPVEMLRKAGPGPSEWLRGKSKPLRAMIPKMVDAAENLAEDKADVVRGEAAAQMMERLDQEIERLKMLKEMGQPIRDSEIAQAEEERSVLKDHLINARLRIDGVRLILATP